MSEPTKAGLEPNLIQAILSLCATAGLITANTGFSAAVAVMFGGYGHVVLASLSVLTAVGTFIKAWQATAPSIPSSASTTVTVDPGVEPAKALSAQKSLEPIAANAQAEAVKAAEIIKPLVNPQQAELDKEFPPTLESVTRQLTDLTSAVPGSKQSSNVFVSLTPHK